MCPRVREREYTVYVKECYDCYEINALKESNQNNLFATLRVRL